MSEIMTEAAPHPRPVTVGDIMARVLRLGLPAAAILLVVAAIIGLIADGSPGAWGAALGVAVPVAFLAVTALVGRLTGNVPLTYLAAVVMGSWLGKVIVLIAVLALLRGRDFYAKPAFMAAFVVGTVGFLAIEAVVMMRGRVLYAEPERDPGMTR